MSSNLPCLNHVSIGTNQFEKAIAFYDAVLATIGMRRVFDLSKEHQAVAYGRTAPEFWVQVPFNGEPAQASNGTHIALLAENTAQVDAFYKTALAQGAKDEGAAGPRPHYGPDYYGCFVRDLDGHKIEAVAAKV